MSAYIIAHVQVTNPVQYEEYKKWSTAAMKTAGAEVCVRGGQVQVLEGDWAPERIVILKFPSFDAAKAFYELPEYLKAREAREGARKGRAGIFNKRPGSSGWHNVRFLIRVIREIRSEAGLGNRR